MSQSTEKDLEQNCAKKNITYKTWSITCEKREEKRIKDEFD